MNSFPTVTFKCSDFSSCTDNHVIEVTAEKIDEKPTHRYLVRARIEDNIHEHGINIGSKDGPVVAYSQEQFQKDVDEARLYAAKQVHFHHTIKEMEGHIK